MTVILSQYGNSSSITISQYQAVNITFCVPHRTFYLGGISLFQNHRESSLNLLSGLRWSSQISRDPLYQTHQSLWAKYAVPLENTVTLENILLLLDNSKIWQLSELPFEKFSAKHITAMLLPKSK